MSPRFNSLRLRISLIVLLILIPAFVLVLWTSEDQRRLEISRAQDDAAMLTRLIATDNRQRVASARELLVTLAQLPVVRDKQVEPCNALFGRLLQEYETYSSLFAVDTETGLGFCSAIPYTSPVDNTSFAWYQEVIQTRGLVISQYRIGPVSGKPVVTLALPVFDDEGQLVAVVAVGLSLSWLNTAIQENPLPAGSTITLLDQTGIILAHHPGDESDVGTLYLDPVLRQKALSGSAGSFRYRPRGQPMQLYSYYHIGADAGYLNVLVGLPEKDVLAEVNRIRARNVTLLAGFTLMVITLTWVGSGLIVRPIGQLTRAIRRVTRGQLSSRAILDTPIFELHDLLLAFNQLAEEVERESAEHLAELEAKNRQMAHEIEERRKAQAQTRILHELTAGLSEAVTSQQVAQVIIEKGARPLECVRATIHLYQETTNTLKLVGHYGLHPNLVTQFDLLPLDARISAVDAYNSGKLVWGQSAADYAALYPDLYQSIVEKQAVIGQSFAALPLTIGKRSIGSLTLFFSQDQGLDDALRALLSAIAGYCAQALGRALLYEQAQQTAVVQERERLARELHDAVSQTLFSASIIAEALPRQWKRSPEKAEQQLGQLHRLTRGALAEMRTLLLELRPAALADSNLKTLFSQLADAVQTRKTVQVALQVGELPDLPPEIKFAFYCITQEALNNIVKHSQASAVTIRLMPGADCIELSVQDNGRGFDTAAVDATRMGLKIMRERAEVIGATLTMTTAPGAGTRIDVVWPTSAPEPPADDSGG